MPRVEGVGSQVAHPIELAGPATSPDEPRVHLMLPEYVRCRHCSSCPRARPHRPLEPELPGPYGHGLGNIEVLYVIKRPPAFQPVVSATAATKIKSMRAVRVLEDGDAKILAGLAQSKKRQEEQAVKRQQEQVVKRKAVAQKTNAAKEART
ncbi:hypothetical protein B0H17DRAFT_1215409 [Mycena rosella]|uniref:Uncharacterized protein n=1 Tax=Mycena rosella TaxID=1033263 RepID=A0AAD7CHK6_MYCRO|nr:hypothetical protein B0H17DRAFT_1215409 [Mycena rosella]